MRSMTVGCVPVRDVQEVKIGIFGQRFRKHVDE